MRRCSLLIPLTLATPTIAHAASETRAGAIVSANVGYSNNPFAQAGGGTGSGYVGAEISPQVQILNERSTFTLSGNAQLQKYFKDYPDNENYRASLDYRGTPSARLTTHARVDLISAIIGSYGAFDGPVIIDPDPDAGVVLPPVNDIGLFGSRDRRRSLRASADFGYALSQRDSITGSAFADLTRYKRFDDFGDYDAFGGTLGYSRQVSQFVRAGVQGSYASYQYEGPRGTTRVYSVQATTVVRLNERWTANGRLGVSFVEGGSVGSTRKNSLSGGLDLCRRGPLSSFCLNASRDVRPTGFNGAQYVSSVGASWNRKLSERDNLSLSAGYSKEGGGRSALFPVVQNEYLRTTVGYDRRLAERLSLTASAQYRDIYGSGINRRADYGGRIGLAYRIGDIR